MTTLALMESALNERLDRLVATPRGWGDPFAVECQYLQALELLSVALTGEMVEVARLWSLVMFESGYGGNTPLAHQVDGDQEAVFAVLVKLLPRLREKVAELQPDNSSPLEAEGSLTPGGD